MSQKTIILCSLLLEPQTSHLQCICWWRKLFSEMWCLGSLVDIFDPFKGHVFFHCAPVGSLRSLVPVHPLTVSVSLSWSAYFSILRMEATHRSETCLKNLSDHVVSFPSNIHSAMKTSNLKCVKTCVMEQQVMCWHHRRKCMLFTYFDRVHNRIYLT
jgi:hypothetical protein